MTIVVVELVPRRARTACPNFNDCVLASRSMVAVVEVSSSMRPVTIADVELQRRPVRTQRESRGWSKNWC